MTHELKTWPEFFQAVKSGEKTFEVRKDDRNFEVGDNLTLWEYEPERGYTLNTLTRKVNYVLRGGQFGIAPGYVVMGLAKETA